jgi:hypothetical protein
MIGFPRERPQARSGAREGARRVGAQPGVVTMPS